MSQQAHKIEEEHIERISKSFNEPSWLKSYRLEGLKLFNALPEEQSNLYTKHAINVGQEVSSLSNTFVLEAKPTPNSSSISEIASGIESGYYFVSTQNEIIASKNIKDLESKGVIFCDLHEALEKHEPLLRKVFESKAIKSQDDKYAALNASIFSSGWLVHVPRGLKLNAPLRLRFYLNTPRSFFSQIWIHAEEDSKVSLLTESYGVDVDSVASDIVEAFVDDNAAVQYSNIQNFSERTAVLSNKKAVCNKDATISWVLGHFGGKLERSRLESIFLKDGAGAEDVEVVLGNRSQKFDIVSDLTHVSQHTRGRILANSVLKDQSKSIFKGMIRIGKHAKNANAYLAGHAILLSPYANSDAIPGLEIETNEVKATHSASVSQIDQEQIFYMMTRGLSEDEAKKFIVLGFLEPAINRIDSEELRDTIRDLVEAKWYGKTGILKKQKREVLFEEEAQAEKPSKDIFEGHYKYR